MAHNFLGQTVPPNPSMLQGGIPFKFSLYGNGREPYCRDLIMPKIRELKPDFFGVLLDSFMVFPWFVELDFAPALSYFYFPSDGGGGLPDGCENILKKVNIPIAMSKFAQQQVKEVHGIKTEYIPHGVDIKNFHRLDEEKRKEIRKKWGLQDKFIVGVVARNQPRKMLDRTVRVAKEICKKYDDIMFFMHCDPFDAAAAFSLLKLIERYQLQNRFIFSGMKYHNTFTYEQLNDVYNLMDVFLLTTCFIPDTLINTNDGVKEINTINKNDLVLTSSGKYRKVLNIIKEKYNGKVLEIKAYGLPKVKCTPNHKIYCVKSGHPNNKGKLLKIKNPKIELRKADELNKLDYLLYPIPKSTEKKKYIETKSYIKKGRICHGKGKNKYFQEFNHPKNKNIPKKIKLDYDFGLFCGFYLSEGCSCPDGLMFTFGYNENELKYVTSVRNIINKILSKKFKFRKSKYKNYEITVYACWIGRMFKDLFGSHSYNKKLPKWMLDTPKEFRKGLIEGVWKGDGCYWKGKAKYGTFELQMVSRTLINQLHNLLITEGFVPTLSVSKNIKDCIIGGIKYKSRDVWYLIINGYQGFGKYINIKEDKRKKIKFRIYKGRDYIYYPIMNIKRKKYDGLVYDLTIEKEHNYITHFLVKNSGEGFGVPIIEAMSCKVPVVVTDYTTTKELVIDNGKCGEAVKLVTEVTGSWVVDRGIMDIKDCVEKIQKLYKNDNLRKKYGEVGRKKVEQFYDWRIVIQMWDDLFRRYKNGR